MTPALALKPLQMRSAKLWRDYPRELIVLVVLGFAAIAAMAGAAWSSPTLTGLPGRSATTKLAPPAPPPLLVRAIAPEDALAINQANPLASGPNPAARPFSLGSVDGATRARALECLTSAVYYEAGSQDTDGQRAVAQVVLNRTRHPAFPASVCQVVYQGSTRATGCQFTFTCDGSLARQPSAAGWARARKVAEAALDGYVYKAAGWATHYHANYVVPYWASSLAKNAIVGAHIFYRWEGGWGRPGAFAQRYSHREPDVAALRQASLIAEATTDAAADALNGIPGAELLTNGEIGKDGKRVAIRFNLAARKAVEDAVAKPGNKPFLDKVSASDNLRWTLTGGMVAADEKPLGKKASPISTGAALSGSAATTAGAASAASAVVPAR